MEFFESFMYDDIKYRVTLLWEDGEPLFRADEVGSVLGIVNVRTSVVNYDNDEKSIRSTYSSTGPKDTFF